MDKSRVEPTIFFIEKISFSLKLFSGHFYGQSFIKTVRGPFCLTNVRNLKVFLEVHGRDIDFAKSEQSYHLTSTDAEAAAVRLLLPLHRKRYMPESYSIVCIYVKWH